MSVIYYRDDTEELIMLPTAVRNSHWQSPLRAYRVYKGGELIYPNPDELRLNYRLQITHTVCNGSRGGNFPDRVVYGTEKHYQTTIETTRPCYVKMRFPGDPDISGTIDWRNPDVMRETYAPQNYWSTGISISDGLQITLPLAPRQSWRTTPVGVPFSDLEETMGHYAVPYFPRMPSEADTAFITREDLDTGDVVIWCYTPSSWKYWGLHGSYQRCQAYQSTESGEPRGAPLDVTKLLELGDERISEMNERHPGAEWHAMKPYYKYWDTNVDVQRLTTEWFNDLYWTEEAPLWLAEPFLLNRSASPIGFMKFYNGRVQQIDRDYSYRYYFSDRTYWVTDNTNPEFASVAAWKDAVFSWPDKV